MAEYIETTMMVEEPPLVMNDEELGNRLAKLDPMDPQYWGLALPSPERGDRFYTVAEVII